MPTEFIKDYFENLKTLMSSIKAQDQSEKYIDFHETIKKVGNLVSELKHTSFKVIFIGNGASASISSHMSTDFWKNGGVKAIAFNDSSLLTCVSNDYGYKHVFEKPMEMFANDGDILIAISSSGKSENILRGVQAAKTKGCKIITLSGFSIDNQLSKLGDFNFFVPAQSYGPVEILHHAICHCILDVIINKRG